MMLGIGRSGTLEIVMGLNVDSMHFHLVSRKQESVVANARCPNTLHVYRKICIQCMSIVVLAIALNSKK